MGGTIISFALGVLSSLLAVLIINVFAKSRNSLNERSLRTAVGFYDERSAVIVPAFIADIKGAQPREFESAGMVRVVRDSDVYAVTSAIQVCRRVKSDPELFSSKSTHLELPKNLVCVGGWRSNDFTRSLQDLYCPGFTVVHRDLAWSDFDRIYYKCGERTFRDTSEVAHAFIVHLSPKLTGRAGHVLLLWGHHGIGNRVAVNYLCENHKRLSALGKQSYFCVIQFRQQEGYKQTLEPLIDISDDAFKSRQPS